jgi:6-phosphofructokinase
MSIIGIPQNIDNEIPYCVKLGFDTAFSKAVEAVQRLL